MRGGAVRFAVGAAVLVLWCAFSVVKTARVNLWVYHEAMKGDLHDSVAINEQRFTAIRKDLPANRAVGYASDLSRDAVQDRFLTAFVQAQSALAPHLVLDTYALSPIVGNFPDARPDSAQLAAMGLHLVRDYGHGVYLLTRSAR